MSFLADFSLREFLSAFVVLFAITDVPGNLPIILNMQNKGVRIEAARAALYSLILSVSFFYSGEAFLKQFRLDI